MVDFSNVKEIEIPEGTVKSITAGQTVLWQKTSSRLPNAYQEVEYIQSTGTQYADTGISCSGGIRGIFKANVQTKGYICGCHNTSSPFGRCGVNANGSNGWQFGYGNNSSSFGIFNFDIDYEVDFQTYYSSAYMKVKGGDYNDWTTLTTGSRQTVASLNCLIFTQQYALTHGEALTQAKLYYLQIYNSNNELVGDFVPCYRKSDNEIGLYNLVNDSFITNSGTGTFIKGGNV